jgi:hypothetical protein
VLSLGGEREGTEVELATWRLVHLEMPNPDGSDDLIVIELLRPLEWVEAHDAESVRAVHLELRELGISGPALVVAVEACPPIDAGAGEVVTGTFTHLNAFVMQVGILSSDEVLEPTRQHPFWSVDRQEWVQAAELWVGERLLTPSGPVHVAWLAAKPGVHRVYNLEVEDAHSYLVGESRLWVHNTCDVDALSASGRFLDPADKGGMVTRAGRALQKHGGRPGSAFPKAKGSPGAINQAGQDVLDDILTSPGSTARPGVRFPGGTDIIAPDGRGARFDSSGVFRGFLEP